VRSALRHQNPVVVWGALALVPKLIDRESKNSPTIPNDVLSFCGNLVSLVQTRNRELVNLNESQAQCALVRLLILYKTQWLYHRANQPLLLKQVHGYINAIQRCLTTIDPGWKPGNKPEFDVLKREVDSGYDLVPWNPLNSVQSLVDLFLVIRKPLCNAIERIGADTDKLLTNVQRLSYTGYLIARSFRFQQIEHMKRKAAYYSDKQNNELERRYRNEFQILHQAALAARDAGDYLGLEVASLP
jgi:hypothetical protein